MNISDRVSISLPAIALFGFSFVFQFVEMMYSAYLAEPPALYSLLGRIAFLWIICWWFENDSNQTAARWPMDMGMFLYIAWIILIPFYLVRTRGIKGLIGILAFLGSIVAAWVVATVVVLLLRL